MGMRSWGGMGRWLYWNRERYYIPARLEAFPIYFVKGSDLAEREIPEWSPRQNIVSICFIYHSHDCTLISVITYRYHLCHSLISLRNFTVGSGLRRSWLRASSGRCAACRTHSAPCQWIILRRQQLWKAPVAWPKAKVERIFLGSPAWKMENGF